MNNDVGVQFVRRLYDWLLRRRLISEHQWGQPSALSRLVRIRLLPALGLSLPALLLCFWYAFLALAAHLRHRAEVSESEPLSIELFQLHLHDKLVHDWHILRMPEPQRKSMLATYGLLVNGEKLEHATDYLAPIAQSANTIDAQLIKGSHSFDVQLRYGGTHYWRPNSPQKSWQVRLKDGKVVEGFDDFSLVKSPDLMSLIEDAILDISRSSGLLTPAYFPVRLLLNKAYMGVYYFEAPPNDSLLRTASRAPGSIYSGNDVSSDATTANRSLFGSAENFSKVTQGIHQQIGDRRELETLIWAINQPSSQVFVTYAQAHLDIDKFALLDALNIVFGCNQYTRDSDEKLYFDPYRDKFEPISGRFRDCRPASQVGTTDTLLQIRLKQVPDYLVIRNRDIFELLRHACSPESLRERVRVLLDKLEPEQDRDPYWDTVELLPAMGEYYTRLMRPASRTLQSRAIESRLYDLAERNRQLRAALEARNIRVELTLLVPSQSIIEHPRKPNPIDLALDITVGGDSAYQITQLAPNWPPDCKPNSWSLSADRNFNDKFDEQADEVIGTPRSSLQNVQLQLELPSGFRLGVDDLQSRQKSFRAVSDNRRYRFFVRTLQCVPVGVDLQMSNLATGESFPIHVVRSLLDGTSPVAQARCVDTFRVEAGQPYPHAWCYNEAKTRQLTLGPGDVEVPETKVFSTLEAVTIAPGTTFRMGEGASLVFQGRLDAQGTRELPIRILASGQVWGGVALQGSGTSGSQLKYIQIRNGSHPDRSLAYYPGTLNIHDTKDVTLDHLNIINSQASESALHVADATNLNVQDATLGNIAGSAIDMQYSSGTFDHVDVFKVGKDAITLRGAQASLRNSQVLAWNGSGIALGNRSVMAIKDTLLAAGNRGISVNEASTVQCDGILLYKNEVGVAFEPSSDWYTERARIKGNQLYAVECKKQIQMEGTSRKYPLQFKGRPQTGELEPLRALVLGSDSWDALDSAIGKRLQGREP